MTSPTADVALETWEGGADGAVCGAGNTIWNKFVTGFTFSTAHAFGQGTRGGHLLVASGSHYGRRLLPVANAVIYFAFPFRLVAAPSVNLSMAEMKGSASATFYADLIVSTDRRLRIRNSAFVQVAQSAANMLPIDSDGRIEWMLNSLTDQQRIRWYSTPTGTTPAWDSGLVATTPVGVIDTVDLGVINSASFEAYFGDLWISSVGFPTFGGGGGGGSTAPTYRDGTVTPSAGAMADATATIPAGTVAGDQLVMMLYGSGGSAGRVDNDPAGWTRLPLDQLTSTENFAAWKKVAAGGDAGTTVTVHTTPTPAGTYRRDLHIHAYAGAQVGDSGSRTGLTSSASHPCPVVAAVDPKAVLLEGCGDTNTPSSSAWDVGALTKRTEHLGSTGGNAISSVTGSRADVGSGSVGGDTITGTLVTSHVAAWAIVIEPASVTASMSVSAGPDLTKEPWAGFVITPTITGGPADSWSWAQSSPVEPDMVTGATVDANGAIHLTAPAAPTFGEVSYTLRVTAHKAGHLDATDTVVVNVFPPTRWFVTLDGRLVPLRYELVT